MTENTDVKPLPGPTSIESKQRVSGTVLRITFENPENDYRVVKLLPAERLPRENLDLRGEVVLVGKLPGIRIGEFVEVEGEWASHSRHGPQFKADWFKPSLPTGLKGIEAYLRSGSVKGIGEVLARRIVEAFGKDTFEVIETDIDRLGGVKGISPRKLAEIKTAWSEAREDRELITFLGDYGIGSAWARRLRKAYGGAALSIVRSNPYRLATEVRGIGFSRADVMARQIGMPLDAPERTQAALMHVLESQAGEGHTFLPKGRLLELAVELLDLDLQKVEPVLARMIQDKRLTEEEIENHEVVFLNSLHEAECECARRLKRLLSERQRLPDVDCEKFLESFEKRRRMTLAPAQRDAVFAIAREGALVLTGGPGTGKTTALRAVIELFQSGGRHVRLAAPTGRAARRLTETSKAQADTIHRLLGFQAHTGRFGHDEAHPLEADLVVVDEVSMLDVLLASDLLRALKPGTCLLLVGDEDQLPSVGPGSVLRDIIASQIFPTARLTEVFRQAESSLIVRNAHRVNRGEFPILNPPEGVNEPDFFFVEREEPAEIIEAIKTLVAERIPRKFQLDPVQDIQILTPMRRGALGVDAINRELQGLLNGAAGKSEVTIFDSVEGTDTQQKLRAGDRVMQTVNQYEKDIANGDIGRVASVDAESGEIIVQFDGRRVSFLSDEARQLALAYAVTIHKSQGSEYPAVVIPIHIQHYVMLQRNLLYTALTRGRRLVCLVGSKRALRRAVANNNRQSRNSALRFYLLSRITEK